MLIITAKKLWTLWIKIDGYMDFDLMYNNPKQIPKIKVGNKEPICIWKIEKIPDEINKQIFKLNFLSKPLIKNPRKNTSSHIGTMILTKIIVIKIFSNARINTSFAVFGGSRKSSFNISNNHPHKPTIIKQVIQ